jgi:hypothetical protein
MARYAYASRGGLGRRRKRAEAGGGRVAAKARSPWRPTSPRSRSVIGTRARDYADGRAVPECLLSLHSVVVALDVPGPSPPCRVCEACSLRKTRDCRTGDCLPRRKFERTRQQRSAQCGRCDRLRLRSSRKRPHCSQRLPLSHRLFLFSHSPSLLRPAGPVQGASGSRPDLASSPHPTHAAQSCSASTSRAQTLISHLLSPANVDRKQCRLRNAAASSSSVWIRGPPLVCGLPGAFI